MVLSRALSLAAVTLVAGCCAMGRAEAQENLDAGKSPSQIFAGTCTACHKSARGLLKTVAPGSLQGFLRQHYTTSPEMAGVLASYLMSNGATDTRYGDKKGAKEAKSDARPAKPDAAGVPAEGERAGRGAKRAARPAEPAEAGKPAAEGQVPQAASEHEGRKSKRLGKHAKPGLGEETPKATERPAAPAKGDAAGGQPEKSDSAITEPGKPEPTKPEAAKPEAAKSDGPKAGDSAKPVDNAKAVASPPQSSANAGPAKEQVNEALPPSLRPDPVPPVTPAPAASSGGGSAQTAAPTPTASPSLSVTVSAPPPPAQPATPPDPPLSR